MTMYVATSRPRIAPKPTMRGLAETRYDLSRWHLLVLLVTTAALISSGLALVEAAKSMRSLHSELDQLQTRQHRLMAEHSRLLLERSSFASLQTVETVATQELRMRFPQTIEEVVP